MILYVTTTGSFWFRQIGVRGGGGRKDIYWLHRLKNEGREAYAALNGTLADVIAVFPLLLTAFPMSWTPVSARCLELITPLFSFHI